jgi:hypothetical protein
MSVKKIYLDPHEKAFAAFALSIDAQMRGKKISRIFRTVGCAFIVDFGKLTKYPYPARSGRILKYGEWHALVDMSCWTIFKNGRKFLTYSNPQQQIDERIRLLKGRCLRRLTVSERGSLRMEFDQGFRLSAPREDDGWVLFCARSWSLAYGVKREMFEFEFYRED